MVQCTKLTKIKSQQVYDIHVHCLMKIEQEYHGNYILCHLLQYILSQYLLQLCLEQSFLSVKEKHRIPESKIFSEKLQIDLFFFTLGLSVQLILKCIIVF